MWFSGFSRSGLTGAPKYTIQVHLVSLKLLCGPGWCEGSSSGLWLSQLAPKLGPSLVLPVQGSGWIAVWKPCTCLHSTCGPAAASAAAAHLLLLPEGRPLPAALHSAGAFIAHSSRSIPLLRSQIMSVCVSAHAVHSLCVRCLRQTSQWTPDPLLQTPHAGLHSAHYCSQRCKSLYG